MSAFRSGLSSFCKPRVNGRCVNVGFISVWSSAPADAHLAPPLVRALIALGDLELAFNLKSELAQRRIRVIGPFPTVDEALIALLHRTHLVAILDLTLRSAWALARTLEHWDVPYEALDSGEVEMDGTPLAPAVALQPPLAPVDLFNATLALISAASSDRGQHDYTDDPA